MARHQVKADGCLLVRVELRPVERDHDLLALAHDEPHPQLEQTPQDDAVVAEQPVELLG